MAWQGVVLQPDPSTGYTSAAIRRVEKRGRMAEQVPSGEPEQLNALLHLSLLMISLPA